MDSSSEPALRDICGICIAACPRSLQVASSSA
jgi:hypothetical protein